MYYRNMFSVLLAILLVACGGETNDSDNADPDLTETSEENTAPAIPESEIHPDKDVELSLSFSLPIYEMATITANNVDSITKDVSDLFFNLISKNLFINEYLKRDPDTFTFEGDEIISSSYECSNNGTALVETEGPRYSFGPYDFLGVGASETIEFEACGNGEGSYSVGSRVLHVDKGYYAPNNAYSAWNVDDSAIHVDYEYYGNVDAAGEALEYTHGRIWTEYYYRDRFLVGYTLYYFKEGVNADSLEYMIDSLVLNFSNVGEAWSPDFMIDRTLAFELAREKWGGKFEVQIITPLLFDGDYYSGNIVEGSIQLNGNYGVLVITFQDGYVDYSFDSDSDGDFETIGMVNNPRQ